MKKTFLIAVLIFCFAFVAAGEIVPDGSSYNAYIVEYDESAFATWRSIQYPDYGGLIFTAYRDDAEITVSVEEKGSYTSAQEYLEKTTANVSLYARVSNVYGPDPWNDPWGTGEGRTARYAYSYASASEKDGAYYMVKYVCPVSERYFVVLACNCWGADADARITEFESMFINTFSLTQVQISTKYLAFLRGAEAAGGEVRLSLDFCSVEYDSDIFAAYVVNQTQENALYTLSPQAMLWMPADSLISGAQRTLPTLEAVQSVISDYYRRHEADAIYQVLLNSENQIVWMLHYNAF